MAGYDGSVIIRVAADTSEAERELRRMSRSSRSAAEDGVDPLADSFNNVDRNARDAADNATNALDNIRNAAGNLAATLGLSFGIDKLVSFGSEAIELASDLQEVQNVVDTAFGEMSGQVDNFAQNAVKQFGMSELSAKQTAGKFMSMSTAMGITGQAATDMALNITGLSGDMASFYNVSQDVASTALASIWTGETETLKQYGIVMTQTNLEQFAMQQGITKTIAEMTEAEKVQLRYNFVLEATKNAQGDFAKTSDSWANQQRVLSESVNALSASIGEGLMETLQPFLQIINDIVGAISNFQESTGLVDDLFMAVITGAAGLLAANVFGLIQNLANSFIALGAAAAFAHAKTAIVSAAIGVLVGVLVQLSGSWGSMSGAERVISILGVLTVAALTAAIAVGAFQSALTLGIAAAAIVAGIAAVMAAINSAQSRMKKFEALNSLPSLKDMKGGMSVPRLALGEIPALARGAVIPPNREFLAVLGDQKSGTNIEAPTSEIESAVMRGIQRSGMNREGGDHTVVLQIGEQEMGRLVYRLNQQQTQRIGVRLAEG